MKNLITNRTHLVFDIHLILTLIFSSFSTYQMVKLANIYRGLFKYFFLGIL